MCRAISLDTEVTLYTLFDGVINDLLILILTTFSLHLHFSLYRRSRSMMSLLSWFSPSSTVELNSYPRPNMQKPDYHITTTMPLSTEWIWSYWETWRIIWRSTVQKYQRRKTANGDIVYTKWAREVMLFAFYSRRLQMQWTS